MVYVYNGFPRHEQVVRYTGDEGKVHVELKNHNRFVVEFAKHPKRDCMPWMIEISRDHAIHPIRLFNHPSETCSPYVGVLVPVFIGHTPLVAKRLLHIVTRETAIRRWGHYQKVRDMQRYGCQSITKLEKIVHELRHSNQRCRRDGLCAATQEGVAAR